MKSDPVINIKYPTEMRRVSPLFVLLQTANTPPLQKCEERVWIPLRKIVSAALLYLDLDS